MGCKDNRDSDSDGIYKISNAKNVQSPQTNNRLSASHNNLNQLNNNNVNFETDGKPPPSPHLNINRMAYSLPHFNARFRRASQIPGARPKSMTSEKVFEKVKPECKSPISVMKTLFPIIVWLSKYKKKDLLPDFISGLTIAVFQVPESMGYSFLAQVKPVYCLYSSFFPIFIYSIMGTSKHASIGTFAALAIMTGAIIQQVPSDLTSKVIVINNDNTTSQHKFNNAEIAIVCSFMVGCYQLIFGFLRLGFVSVYMSEQFLNGFTCAVAYHVLGSQFQHMFGIEVENKSGVFTLTKEIMEVISHISETNIVALSLSLICIIILLTFKIYINDMIKEKFKIKVPFPIEIFIVIGAVIASVLFDLNGKHAIRVVGEVERGLPSPRAPYWEIIQYVWAPCIPLSIVSYAITYSVGKSFAIKHEYEIDSSQELIALGGSNLFSSFFSCIPVGASLSRSAVQESSGGRTQLVSLVNCVGICAVLLYFGAFLEQLPDAVLATVISVALRILLLEVKLFKKYWDVSKIDGSIWLVTFLSVIILDIDYGLYIGLIWSLITLIYKSQRPRTYLLGTVGEQTDVFVPIGKYVNAKEVPGIKIYQFCGPLHFANVDYFMEGLEQKMEFSTKEIKRRLSKLEKLEKSCYKKKEQLKVKSNRSCYHLSKDTIPRLPSHIIIDCSMFSYIDTDGIKTIKRTVIEYESIGIKTFLGGCPSHVTKLLERDHFYAAVPAHYIYISIYDAIQHAIQQRENISIVVEEPEEEDGVINSSYDGFEEVQLEIDQNIDKETEFVA